MVAAWSRPGDAEPVLDTAQVYRQSCAPPSMELTMPDGSKASRDEMAAAQAAFRALDAAVSAYAQCLAETEARLAIDHPAALAALRDARAELNDAAVHRAQAVAADFNEALEAYRQARITPPRVAQMATKRVIDECYPPSLGRANIRVEMTIAETGEVAKIRFPPTLPVQVQRAIRCIVRYLKFAPGMIDGKPVEAEAVLPLKFAIDSPAPQEPLKAPVLLTPPEAVVALHDDCLPQYLAAGGQTVLSLKLSERGRVTDADVAVSSGSRDVDRVAICIARRLEFEPLRFRDRPVDAVMVPWTATVTPSRQGD